MVGRRNGHRMVGCSRRTSCWATTVDTNTGTGGRGAGASSGAGSSNQENHRAALRCRKVNRRT